MTPEMVKKLIHRVQRGTVSPDAASKILIKALDAAYYEGAKVGYDNACWQSADECMQDIFEQRRRQVLTPSPSRCIGTEPNEVK